MDKIMLSFLCVSCDTLIQFPFPEILFFLDFLKITYPLFFPISAYNFSVLLADISSTCFLSGSF